MTIDEAIAHVKRRYAADRITVADLAADAVLLSELARLRSALPRTADGVTIVPGDTVYWESAAPETIEGIKVDCVYNNGDADQFDGEHRGIPMKFAYASRAAAFDAGRGE